jgi:hypothetical protein
VSYTILTEDAISVNRNFSEAGRDVCVYIYTHKKCDWVVGLWLLIVVVTSDGTAPFKKQSRQTAPIVIAACGVVSYPSSGASPGGGSGNAL